jgi:hypothetical protein
MLTHSPVFVTTAGVGTSFTISWKMSGLHYCPFLLPGGAAEPLDILHEFFQFA